MVGEVPLGEVPEVNFVFSFHKLAKGTSHGPKRMELKNLPPVTIYVRTENTQFAAHRPYCVPTDRGLPAKPYKR